LVNFTGSTNLLSKSKVVDLTNETNFYEYRSPANFATSDSETAKESNHSDECQDNESRRKKKHRHKRPRNTTHSTIHTIENATIVDKIKKCAGYQKAELIEDF
jgi:hypothetical protein